MMTDSEEHDQTACAFKKQIWPEGVLFQRSWPGVTQTSRESELSLWRFVSNETALIGYMYVYLTLLVGLYWLPTSGHKFSGLNQHRFIILQSWRSEV